MVVCPVRVVVSRRQQHQNETFEKHHRLMNELFIYNEKYTTS
jgi:hypothetical protein